MKYYLCFDIGGSSMKCGFITHMGKILDKKTYPMTTTIEELIACMKDYYSMHKELYNIEGIAISSCGSVDCETGIIAGSSAVPFVHGFSWKELIQKEFNLPCAIENDANCAALSEICFGQAKDVKNMAFFVIGTGVGGAIITDGKISHGANRYAGEFGMMLVEDDLGNIQNFSLVASTNSMVRKMEQLTSEKWNGKRIFKEAEAGNQLCQETISTFYHNLAMGVFNIQHTIDPEMILFGGGISEREDFVDQLMKKYHEICAKVDFDTLEPNCKCCTYRQDANLLGALANYLSQV